MRIPEAYTCPITKKLMIDPVMNRSGRSYERSAIIECITSIKHPSTCPVTKEPLHLKDLIPNSKLRYEILEWRQVHGDHEPFFDEQDGFVRTGEVMKLLTVALSTPHGQKKRTFFGRIKKVHASSA